MKEKRICKMLSSLSGCSVLWASNPNSRSWDTQLQRKDASCKIESVRDRLLYRMPVFFRRNVICIKSGLNGSRNGTNQSTGSNLSVQVNRVYCLLKQLACYPHKRKVRIQFNRRIWIVGCFNLLKKKVEIPNLFVKVVVNSILLIFF